MKQKINDTGIVRIHKLFETPPILLKPSPSTAKDKKRGKKTTQGSIGIRRFFFTNIYLF